MPSTPAPESLAGLCLDPTCPGAFEHPSGSIELHSHADRSCAYCHGTGSCDYRSCGPFYSPVPNTPGGEHECLECDAANDARADEAARDTLADWECGQFSDVVRSLSSLLSDALRPPRVPLIRDTLRCGPCGAGEAG